MSDTFIINKNTSVDDAKKMKDRMRSMKNSHLLSNEKPLSLSYKSQMVIISLLCAIALFTESFFVFTDPYLEVQKDLALQLNDTFALSKINSGSFLSFLLIVICTAGLFAGSCFTNKAYRKKMALYKSLENDLNFIINSENVESFEEKEYFFHDTDDVTIMTAVLAIALCLLSVTVSWSKNGSYDGYLKEVKGSGELYSIHYNRSFYSDEFTIFEERNGEIVKTEIPSRVPVNIKQIGANEKGRFEYYYRTHDDQVIKDKYRSTEYYLTVYLPKEMNIEGSKML